MDVAVVGPSPVPYVHGGAERHMGRLYQALSVLDGVNAELVKLPSPESSFWEVVDSYRRFFDLDLQHFDLTVAVKYPGWMARGRLVVHLAHRLRGLYDTYALTRLPAVVRTRSRVVRRLLAHLDAPPQRYVRDVNVAFDLIEAARPELEGLDVFPGPLIRRIVRYLDDAALAPDRVARYAAISSLVAGREGYFPPAVDVEVHHVPSPLDGLYAGPVGDAFFTVSRLEPPKRVDLVIRAFRQVPGDVRLRIAGTGPSEQELRALAADDPRVEMLGFVDDRQLVEEYANALGVVFVPWQEDFGLVTVEAMRAGRAVVTTADAGGPTELVQDGVTGFVARPTVNSLAGAMTALAADRARAAELGRAGAVRAAPITWENLAWALVRPVPAPARVARPKPRPKLAVLSTFRVVPANTGGRVRIYELYRRLAGAMDVEIVCLGGAGETEERTVVQPRLVHVVVPKSERHQRLEDAIVRRLGGISVTDVSFPLLWRESPEFVEAARAAVRAADLVVLSHPYVLPAVRDLVGPEAGRPVIYEAHNVELDLKRQLLAWRPAEDVLAATEDVEREAVRLAERVIALSADDAGRLAELYDVNSGRIVVAPPGVDATPEPLPPSWRPGRRRQLGLPGRPLAVFLGSWHQPNVEAALSTVRLAEARPDVDVMIVGSVCRPLEVQAGLPENLKLAGEVSAAVKDAILGLADVAVNPVVSGSGVNVKMLDFLAAGAPIVSSALGLRGLGLTHHVDVVQAEPDELVEAVTSLIASPDLADRMAAAALVHVRGVFDWQLIASLVAGAFGDVLGRRVEPGGLRRRSAPPPRAAGSTGAEARLVGESAGKLAELGAGPGDGIVRVVAERIRGLFG